RRVPGRGLALAVEIQLVLTRKCRHRRGSGGIQNRQCTHPREIRVYVPGRGSGLRRVWRSLSLDSRSGESSCPLEVQVAQDAMSRKGSDQHSFRVHVSGEVAQYASMSRRRAGHAWGEVKRDGIEDYPSTRGTLPRADPRTVVTTVNAGEDAPLGEGVERVKGRRCRGRARD